MTDTPPDPPRYAVGVVGHNIVIDCGSHEEAMSAVERVTLDARPSGDEALRAAAGTYEDAASPFLYGYPMTDGERDVAWETLREASIALRAALAAPVSPSPDQMETP